MAEEIAYPGPCYGEGGLVPIGVDDDGEWRGVRLERGDRVCHGVAYDDVRGGAAWTLLARLELAARASGRWHVLHCGNFCQMPFNLESMETGKVGAVRQLAALETFAAQRLRELAETGERGARPSPAAKGALWVVDDFDEFAQDRTFAVRVVDLVRRGPALGVAVWAIVPTLDVAAFGAIPGLRDLLTATNTIAMRSGGQADSPSRREGSIRLMDPHFALLSEGRGSDGVMVRSGHETLIPWEKALPEPDRDEMVRDGLSALL
jgi:hypothetical protein